MDLLDEKLSFHFEVSFHFFHITLKYPLDKTLFFSNLLNLIASKILKAPSASAFAVYSELKRYMHMRLSCQIVNFIRFNLIY